MAYQKMPLSQKCFGIAEQVIMPVQKIFMEEYERADKCTFFVMIN